MTSEIQTPAVEAGRRALNEWWWRSYPWYDKTADAARPIDVSEPWYAKLKFWDWFEGFQWPSWNWSWPGSLLEWVAWIGLALVLALLTYLLLRAYAARRRGGRKPAAAFGADVAERLRRVEALPAGVGLAPGDLLAEAARLYREGNYRQAIIYLFSHELIELDKHHLVRLAKGKTNRQYVRELDRAPSADWSRPLRALVERTMIAFEDVFFGHYALDRARFESCWLRLGEFDALVAEASA